MYTYYIGIGSNLGDREGYLAFAVNQLVGIQGVTGVEHSSWIEPPPWGPVEQGPFLNGILTVKSTLEPLTMLETIWHIERLAGRQREIHWGSRTLDLDIVWIETELGQVVCVEEPNLVVPHPYFWERQFVLEPLREVYHHFSYEGVSISDRIEELRVLES